MTFKDRIDRLLEIKKLDRLSINKIEKALNVDGTIYKGIKDPDYIPSSELVSEIIRIYNLKRSWWDNPLSNNPDDIYVENHTPEDKPGDNGENEVTHELRRLIEKNDKYSLVPNLILTQYEIQSKAEILRNEEVLKKALAFAEQTSATKDIVIQAKNDLIAELKKEIAELRMQKPVMATQKA